MSEKVRVFLGILIGIVCAIAVFCLVVVIGCSINGLTFGQQISSWFGGTANPSIAELLEQAPII